MGKLVPYAGKETENTEIARVARLDVRLTEEQRAKLLRVAKSKYRTLSSMIAEYIDGLEEKM